MPQCAKGRFNERGHRLKRGGKEMEYGFVEFFDKKNDKMAENFFRTLNNIDALGLRRMNIRLSNILFPFGSTLMPNLEYFYYLNAIYHSVVNNENSPTKSEEKMINDIEREISKAIRENENSIGKGFYGETVDDSVRAYSRYKSSMKKMHYMEKEWKPNEKENVLYTWWLKSDVPLQKWLEETKRYKAVKNICDKYKKIQALKEAPEKQLEEEKAYRTLIERLKNNEWGYKLEPLEKLDFVCRVIQPYEKNGAECSLFAYIVMYYFNYKDDKIVNNKNKNYEDKDYINEIMKEAEKRFSNKYKAEDIPGFDKIGEDIIEKSKSKFKGTRANNIDLPSRHSRIYDTAERYSALQLIAKIAYNMCLYSEHSTKYVDYEKSEKEHIKKYTEKYMKKNKKNMPGNFYDSKIKEIFCGDESGKEGDASDFNRAFDFINDIHGIIKNHYNEINKDDDNAIKDCIEKIKERVKEREKEILGDDSRIESRFGFEPISTYMDTFRWEYRPEFYKIEKIEASQNSGDNEAETQEDNSQENNKKPHNLCARYYIWELFAE